MTAFRDRCRAWRRHLWQCPFRPFFLLTACSAILLMAWWLAGLLAGAPLPPAAGGPVVWHAHELLFGFAMASVAGFLLTAVPEFTGTAAIPACRLRALAAMWLAGRGAFALSGWIGAIPAAVCDLGWLALLMASIARPLWQQPGRRHLAFLHALALLTAVHAGFYLALLGDGDPLPWLRLAVAGLMVLIVVAMSRISMRLVNDVLATHDGVSAPYLARPPRRNLLVAAIVAQAAGEAMLPGHPATGWLALAAAAAALNLLNDWHIGRALWRRWVLIPYLGYWCMALGFAITGVGRLLGIPLTSAGEHLQLVGTLGLSVCMVMAVAGRLHGGWALDSRHWLPLTASALLAAALVRASAGLPGMAAHVTLLWWLAGTGWLLAWLGYLRASWPMLTGPRPDGGDGCAEAAAPSPEPGP